MVAKLLLFLILSFRIERFKPRIVLDFLFWF